jgi:hypothetical protein
MTKSDTSSRRDATIQKKWFILLIVISISVAANLRLLSCASNNIMNQSGVMRDYDATLPFNATSTTTKYSVVSHHSNNPSVACFFMVDQKTIEKAMAVRYSHWGKRCTQFVIFSNGISSSEKVKEQQVVDNNTILVDIHYVIESELQTRNIVNNNNTNASDEILRYTTFPQPKNETKQYLSIKSFYSWLYMARIYANQVDYIMKADPDTYMLMDNYFHYLSHNYKPTQHVYVGRVFKTNGNHHDPFVTGLSATISQTTAKLLLSKSTIHKNESSNPVCSAEEFVNGGEADDYTLAQCLSSMGIYPSYTRDDLGRERFLHFNPDNHVFDSNHQPEWYSRYSFTPHSPRSMCCSEEACAFHYVGLDRQNDTLVWDKVFGLWHWKNVSKI